MKKKLLSFILMMSLLISSLAGLPVEVLAGTDVSYVDEEGNTKTLQPTEYTKITSATSVLTEGWYVVQENVTRNSSITVDGDVHLILADGKTLSATVLGSSNYKAGIAVTSGNSLTIYGQEGGTGKLVAKGGPTAAGIGGNGDEDGGTITITGGELEAIGGTNAAGIGGGSSGSGGTIDITDGTVKATGGNRAAGIGSGYNYSGSNGGTITISDGKVEATGSPYLGSNDGGAGIGGSVSAITISGGEIEATGDKYGAGIGSSSSAYVASIKITGGIVTAKGGEQGAGIGGGNNASGGVMTITGGKVTATGGDKAAGIGGGWNRSGGSIDMTGGTVFAQGGTQAQDIGNGFSSSSNDGTLKISGGAALFLRNDKSVDPITDTHHHTTFSDSTAVTDYAVPGTWNTTFGAWLPLPKIMFNSAGGSPIADIIQAPDTVVTPPADPSREGYSFTGWKPALPATMPDTDMAVIAQWKADSIAAETYTVSFDSKGGSSVEPITDIEENATIVLPENPRKDGYIFKGWLIENPTAVDADIPFTETTKIIEDISVYAKWEAEEAGQLTPIDPEEPIEKEDKEEESPAKAQLPKTGARSPLLFYGLGGLSILLGIKNRTKKK